MPTDSIIEIAQWIFTSLIVGGALWKGLDSVANALAKRADAIMTERRLDYDQMQSNYDNAMTLLNQQAKRIEALHGDITNYENRIDKLCAGYEKRLEVREMDYVKKIKELQFELDKVKSNHAAVMKLYNRSLHEFDELKRAYAELTELYKTALERIKTLEKKTGPLPDVGD